MALVVLGSISKPALKIGNASVSANCSPTTHLLTPKRYEFENVPVHTSYWSQIEEISERPPFRVMQIGPISFVHER